ncbi:MAG: hypothetical protein WB987_13390 [Candidatus Acidiferrales bacterium]
MSDSLPLLIRGSDLLGQPFEERTATLNFNLHGCRYSSKHHLPKNTWLTIELPKNSARRNVRARVAWIQRPHSVREFFQIAVELESPENIWGLDSPPVDWISDVPVYHSAVDSSTEEELSAPVESSSGAVPTTLASYMGKLMADIKDSSFATSQTESGPGPEFTPAADSPFLRELRAELDRHAAKAVESAAAQARERIQQSASELEEKRRSISEDSFRKWKEEFEKTQNEAREQFAEHVAARRNESITGLTADIEENLGRARDLMADFEKKMKALREEAEAAQETISRMAQARLQLEGAEAVRSSKASAESSKEHAGATESELSAWRERLQSEMNLAQAQWNELLQSSLDSSLQRLVEELSQRSQEAQQSAEHKMSERFADLIQPVTQAAAKAGETLTQIREGLEHQVAAARASLEEVERSAARIRENSAQFEAAGHDSLNELHRRLENVLDAQTAEMARRIEVLGSGMSQRISPVIEAMGNQQVERAVAQMEAKLAPHLERVPALLRELAAREVQVEEGLRLHRERLRQVSENNQRDVASRMVFTLSELHRDFESARTQALAKWNEELDASGVRASHSATESLSRASEWFQQEARSRLQVLVEQALASAGAGLNAKVAEANENFEIRLTEQASDRIAQVGQKLEGLGNDVVVRTRTQLEAAAEAAASSFGEVVRGISDQEVILLGQRSRAAVHERSEEFERSSSELLQNLEADAKSSMERFHSQIGEQLESRIAEGRGALAVEFGIAMDGYRAERDAHERQWINKLSELSGAAEGKYQERLENASDSWSVSSVRRLNEHGQNVIESLMRSADQALRDSFAKVFEGLSELLRERAPANSTGAAGFAPAPNREAGEQPSPRQ